jgi:hypothetical protein
MCYLSINKIYVTIIAVNLQNASLNYKVSRALSFLNNLVYLTRQTLRFASKSVKCIHCLIVLWN